MRTRQPASRLCALPALMLIACAAARLAAGDATSPAAGSPTPPTAPTPPAPNIVLIVADDLGYGDLGCYGCRDIPTPHIDALAGRGVRFTSGYVSGAVCGPSRAGLFSGRWQNRFGFELNWDNILPVVQPALAEMLARAGYATALVGKWHLGHTPDSSPLSRGFERFFGNIGGKSDYLPGAAGKPVMAWRGERAAQTHIDFRGRRMLGFQEVAVDGYLTDRLTDEAVSFIAGRDQRPFFLMLAHHAPHEPLQVDPARAAAFATRDYAAWGAAAERRRTYAAMVASVDDSVGRVVAELRRQGIEERTLVVVLSDNGAFASHGSNAPLRGEKGTCFEGGIRVPWIMSWPGRIAPAAIAAPVCTIDLWPTLRALAGGRAPTEQPNDGVDLMPLLAGAPAPARDLCWRYGAARALRAGAWKLVQHGDGAAQLFDLEADVGEADDLAARRPDVVADLERRFRAWEILMAPPQWGRSSELEAWRRQYERRLLGP